MANKEIKKRPAKAAATEHTRRLTKKQAKDKIKKAVKSRQPLPGSLKLTGISFSILRQFWKPLAGIVIIYLLLNIFIASGINNANATFTNIKTNLNNSGGPNLAGAAAGFLVLAGSGGSNGSPTSSILQSLLLVIESLVIIWALRHLLSGQLISVKQAYYSSTTPLIPFLLVLVVLLIQLMPVTIGGAVLAAIATSIFPGLAAASVVSGIILLFLGGWSLYMISSTVFAIYIVTLPDVQPRQALRSAKELVNHRRWIIVRKLLFLPLLVTLVMGFLVVPLILIAPVIVPAAFYILSMLAILFVHTYLYSLYREMLQ